MATHWLRRWADGRLGRPWPQVVAWVERQAAEEDEEAIVRVRGIACQERREGKIELKFAASSTQACVRGINRTTL